MTIQRPFKVLGVQQIAIGGPDKGRLQKLWVDMFGLEVTGTFKSERENVDEDICAIGTGPFKVEVDLMQPLDPDKKPAVHTTPLNYFGLWIDDLPVAVEWLTAQGVRFAPGGIRKGAAGFDITFLHPKANDEFPIGGEGVLIELVQAPPEVVNAFAALAANAHSVVSDLKVRPAALCRSVASAPTSFYKSPSDPSLSGFCFGQRRFNDGAFSVHFGGLVCTLGVGRQVGQGVLSLGDQPGLVGGLFMHQAFLA